MHVLSCYRPITYKMRVIYACQPQRRIILWLSSEPLDVLYQCLDPPAFRLWTHATTPTPTLSPTHTHTPSPLTAPVICRPSTVTMAACDAAWRISNPQHRHPTATITTTTKTTPTHLGLHCIRSVRPDLCRGICNDPPYDLEGRPGHGWMFPHKGFSIPLHRFSYTQNHWPRF